jgi:uncharacterized protein YodC (DUF2158 family)
MSEDPPKHPTAAEEAKATADECRAIAMRTNDVRVQVAMTEMADIWERFAATGQWPELNRNLPPRSTEVREIRAGNLVRHKSGGPIMMVEAVRKADMMTSAFAECVWVENNQRRHNKFHLDAIQVVYADGSPRDYSEVR